MTLLIKMNVNVLVILYSTTSIKRMKKFKNLPRKNCIVAKKIIIKTLPCHMHTKLAQLRASKSPVL